MTQFIKPQPGRPVAVAPSPVAPVVIKEEIVVVADYALIVRELLLAVNALKEAADVVTMLVTDLSDRAIDYWSRQGDQARRLSQLAAIVRHEDGSRHEHGDRKFRDEPRRDDLE